MFEALQIGAAVGFSALGGALLWEALRPERRDERVILAVTGAFIVVSALAIGIQYVVAAGAT